MAENIGRPRVGRVQQFLRTLRGRLIVTTCFFLVPMAVTLTMVIVQSTCNPKSWECSYMGPAFMFLGLGFSSAVFIVTIRYCRRLQLERQQQRLAGMVGQGCAQLHGTGVGHDPEASGENDESSVTATNHPAFVYWIDAAYGSPCSSADASNIVVIDQPPSYDEAARAGIDVTTRQLLGLPLYGYGDTLLACDSHTWHASTDCNVAENCAAAAGAGKSRPVVLPAQPVEARGFNTVADKSLPSYEELVTRLE